MSIGCTFNICFGKPQKKIKKKISGARSVAVFSDAAVGVDVVGLRAFTLDTGAIHGPDAAQLVVRVTPAAQTRLEEHVKRGKRTF